jgi:subtilisin family serine protease
MMKDQQVRTFATNPSRPPRWLGVGLTSSVLLVSCLESEEDLIADSVVTVETTSVTETGDGGAENLSEATAAIEQDDDDARLPLAANRADMPPFVPYEVIVKFRDPASSSTRSTLLARAQLEGITTDTSVVRFADESGGRRSTRDAIAATWAHIDELRARADVEFAHPNWLFDPSLAPNDEHYPLQWHYPQVNLPAAWDLTTGSPTVRIAILDTARTDHTDLSGKWVPGVEYDAYNEDGDATSTTTWNHAVAVASIAGGSTNNTKNSAGVCWNCSLLNVDVEYANSEVMDTAAVTRGIYWAVANGARVINASFENKVSCSSPAKPDNDIPALKAAVAYATSQNVTIVAAAGNAGNDAKDTSPASCPGVIAVAATDKNKALASYSNYGSVTLAAPGGNASLVNGKIGSDAYGKALGTTCDTDPYSGFGTSTAGVVANWTTATKKHCSRYISGTSLAAPHVTGVVGLMLSRNPSLTPSQIRQILQNTATPACGGKCGAGLLDAAAAVKQAATLPVNDPKPTASFTVQCSGLQCTFNGGASTDNSGIVAYEWILPGQQFRLGAVVQAFMPGYGAKSAQLRVTDNRGQSTLITKNFSFSQPSVTPVAGQYHNPDRPGNRLDVYETVDSSLVVTWYTFDKAGTPVWYTSGAGPRTGARWSQDLYKTTIKNGLPVHTIVGTVSLDFSTSTSAWLSWQANNAQVFDHVAGGERFTYLFGGQGRSGAWYRPGDSGWGISVHESGQQLETAVGFHTPAGAPMWASSQRMVPNGNLSIPLTVYKGRGLCPSCGGTSATSILSGYSGSMTLQIANGSVTTGTASTSFLGPNYTSIKKQLGPVELLTKP